MPFHLWLKKIDGKLGHHEQFFSNRTSLFDAMPAVWKNLSVEDRHEVVNLIDGFYTSREFEDAPIWTKRNVMELVKYAPLGDIGKLRSSYLAAKIDPSVFVYNDGMLTPATAPTSDEAALPVMRVENNSDDHHCPPHQDREQQQQPMIDHVCSWRPREMLDKYTSTQHSLKSQKAFFNHITNFVACIESSKDTNLMPSAYLDVDVSADQIKLLKPTHKDIVMGSILRETIGIGAVKLIAKRRIDALDGNIGSYSRLLNSSARLKQIQEVNALTASVAEITRDIDNARKRRRIR